MKNMTCSTLPILSDICAWSAFSDVPSCVFLLSEKIGNITHNTSKCEKYIYNSTWQTAHKKKFMIHIDIPINNF